MFDTPTARKQFLSAPPTVASLIAAVLEPAVAALLLLLWHLLLDEPVTRSSKALAVLLLVLMFPGKNRFAQSGVATLIDIGLSWLGVLGLLVMMGWVTDSLHDFYGMMVLAWAVSVPLTLWLLVRLGGGFLRFRSSLPDARRPAVIVGANSMSHRVAQALALRKPFGQDLIGLFDDRSATRQDLPANVPLLGTLQDLHGYIDKHGVKDVYITLPLTSQPRILNLMESLQNTTASLHLVPDVFGVSVIQGRLEDMGGVPVVGLLISPFSGINGLLKRVSDTILASILLVLLSPVMLAVAAGVKLSSPGPVIFKQRRVGLDGEPIEVYKFRSMTVMDNGADVRQARRDDPRITPFGAFIRRTSLDELPQFVNVLQGRMSIVGPRPHAVAHNDQYRKVVKAYMARHKVRPGITGWAQVNGLRGETDTVEKMARRVEFDLDYLRNWSLGLDLLIIARTAKLMFFDRHAY